MGNYRFWWWPVWGANRYCGWFFRKCICGWPWKQPNTSICSLINFLNDFYLSEIILYFPKNTFGCNYLHLLLSSWTRSVQQMYLLIFRLSSHRFWIASKQWILIQGSCNSVIRTFLPDRNDLHVYMGMVGRFGR